MQHFITRRTSKLYASRNDVIVTRNTSSGARSSRRAREKNSVATRSISGESDGGGRGGPAGGSPFDAAAASTAGSTGSPYGPQPAPQPPAFARYASIRLLARPRLHAMPFARRAKWS